MAIARSRPSAPPYCPIRQVLRKRFETMIAILSRRHYDAG
jgi:hypothetical protein